MGKRWTLTGLKWAVRKALSDHGVAGTVDSAVWTGDWTSDEPQTRTASVVFQAPSGGQVSKLVTVESDGSWNLHLR